MRQGTKAADAIADPHLPSKHGPGAGAPSGRKLKSSHCDLGWGIRLMESAHVGSKSAMARLARLALYIKPPSLADPSRSVSRADLKWTCLVQH